MTLESACAHVTVKYAPIKSEDGTTIQEQWCCRDCPQLFWPEHLVRELVGALNHYHQQFNHEYERDGKKCKMCRLLTDPRVLAAIALTLWG